MILKSLFVILMVVGCAEYGEASSCFSYKPNNYTSCDNIFANFHACAAEFLETAMRHSNPYTVCTDNESYLHYYYMTMFYSLLTTQPDFRNNSNKVCSDEYLSKNQQSVILTILGTANQIWESANCGDCYNGTANETQIFSKHKQEIQDLHDKYTICSHRAVTPAVICHDCEKQYMNLNTKFDHEKKLREGKICFDLEDLINKTRQEWSGTFKCCKDKKDSLTAFFSLFSTVMIIAVVFYASIYVSGCRTPHVDLLDSQQISPDTTASTLSPSPAPAPSTSSASTSQRPSRVRKSKQKPKATLNINDSDDDEPLIRDAPALLSSTPNLVDI